MSEEDRTELLAIIGLIAIIIFTFSLPWVIWNSFVVPIFHAPSLTWWQSVCLILMIKLTVIPFSTNKTVRK